MAQNTTSCTSDMEKVVQIEKLLLKDEKISLIFLLFDQADLALQYATVCPTPLQDWSHQPGSLRWLDKFKEALCIIGCYNMLKIFGISKEEADVRYIPKSLESSLFVNRFKKALYHICEELSKEECKELVRLVWHGCSGEQEYKYDVLNLELYLLTWMSIGIISHNNVDNVTQALKQMERKDLQDKLLQVMKSVNCITIKEKKLDMRTSLGNLYTIDAKNMGLCIIVNQKNFSAFTTTKQPFLETRIGTDVDRDRLYDTFRTYGFEIIVLENITSIELKKALENEKQKIKQSHSSFVLCVLSHGEKDVVYCTDNKHIAIDELKSPFMGTNCPALIGKPKLFFIQACQGDNAQKVVSHPSPRYDSNVATDSPTCSATSQSPAQADCLTFYSTVSGCVSFRDLLKGSMFIEALCSSLMRYSLKYPIFDIIQNTNYLASMNTVEIETKMCTMMPENRSTLRCDFKLFYEATGVVEATLKRLQRALFNQILDKFLSKIYLKNLSKN